MTNLLMILDGYGHSESDYGNAVRAAKQPYLASLFETYPHTLINASGLAVGLPDGQMGNSEVGHMNMGAGRVVYQELTRITKSIEDGDFFRNPALVSAMARARKTGKALHLMGLLSDGGVHSHMTHIKALLRMAKEQGVPNTYLHAFLDGRDVPPTSAVKYVAEIQDSMAEIGYGNLASLAGRYYPMDRDKRWERVEPGYDCLTLGKTAFQEGAKLVKACYESTETGESHANEASLKELAQAILKASYDLGTTDEFVLPTFLLEKEGTVQDGDSLVFFDFRPDRMRQIVRSFADPDFESYGFARKAVRKDLSIVCMTQYDATIPNVTIAFPPQSLRNTFGEYVSGLGKTQLRIAETEKYAHVTFFFNGGTEAPNPGEDRILVPSPKVATYDLKPEMSAPEVAEKAAEAIRSGKYDFMILNFANPDMVGHTGNWDAAIRALEALDGCVKKVVEALKEAGGNLILTADHGNSDVMLDADGRPVTSHSVNPVPFLVARFGADGIAAAGGGAECAADSIADASGTAENGAEAERAANSAAGPDKEFVLRKDGALCDVIPTLLCLAGIPKPAEMEGKSIVQ